MEVFDEEIADGGQAREHGGVVFRVVAGTDVEVAAEEEVIDAIEQGGSDVVDLRESYVLRGLTTTAALKVSVHDCQWWQVLFDTDRASERAFERPMFDPSTLWESDKCRLSLEWKSAEDHEARALSSESRRRRTAMEKAFLF
jgi:hypothetical protein